jgi:signal transduction histidine kinase
VQLRLPFRDIDTGRWLAIICLLLGVLAPTAAVLWFMNDSLATQRELSRRELDSVYQSEVAAQSKLFNERSATYWKDRMAAIERQLADRPAAAAFALAVKSGQADAAIVLGQDGRAAYPAPATTPAADSTEHRLEWTEARRLEDSAALHEAVAAYAAIAKTEQDPDLLARATQAQIRCLVKLGQKAEAAQLITEHFRTGPLMAATDLQGRSIAADVLLLALHLDAKDRATAAQLIAMANDYNNSLPSTQRLFLMNQLHGANSAAFPTYNAEMLANQSLEAGEVVPEQPGLRASRIPEVWEVASGSRRVIALFRETTVVSATRLITEGSPVHATLAPGTAAGQPPDWHIEIARKDDAASAQVSHRQLVSYLWVAFLAIAVVAIVALIAAQALRRQLRLARMKTDLVAAVSHELKTPLTSVSLLVDSLLAAEKPDPQRTHDYLELIARENLRLSGVIENFLTFSRLERKRQKFEFSETQPETVIQSAIAAAQERLQAPGCQVEVEVSPNLPAVRADESALTTVLINLLDNAWKYSPGEKRIAVRAYQENSRVIFAVEDNGIGIAPREQKKIFRRFYQVDRRLTRDVGGCGLGLSIVEFIVRAHGGSITVKSQPGHGSTFSVAIPEAA